MFTYILYALAGISLIVSFIKDKKKTKMALKKAWKSFENIAPQFLTIILLISILLSVLSPEVISNILGKQSGWLGIFIASIIGAITLVPGFIVFPLAAILIKNGAAYMQIAVFISTLMMVGIVTVPMEIKYFGKKVTIMRNVFGYVFSFIVAIVIGVVLG